MEQPNGFEVFFEHPIYLKYKHHLYNHRVRQKAILDIFNQIKPEGQTVEIGCGIAPMLEPSQPNVLFMDRSVQAIDFLKNAGFKTAFVSDATAIALKDESCEVVISSEVLEHVPDDKVAVREMYRILKPGGHLLMSVPIHPAYYGFDDAYVSHVRRYKVWPFLKMLRKNGFQIREIKKVTALIDRLLLMAMVWVYNGTRMEGTERKDNSLLLRRLFPFYKLANLVLSWIVRQEAKLMPLAVTADLLVWCQKDSSPARN